VTELELVERLKVPSATSARTLPVLHPPPVAAPAQSSA
jgi:hypothetical protein